LRYSPEDKIQDVHLAAIKTGMMSAALFLRKMKIKKKIGQNF
jgi:hypothetical protein